MLPPARSGQMELHAHDCHADERGSRVHEQIGRDAAEFILHSSEWFGRKNKPMTVFSPYKVIPGESISPLKKYECCTINTGV